MNRRVLPQLAIHHVGVLPTPASDYAGVLLRTVDGLFFSNGSNWGLVELNPIPVPVNTVAPVVSGASVPSDTATTTNGTWTNSPTSYQYQWQELLTGVWTDISGETSSTYEIDHEGIFRCEVIASNDAYGASSPAYSNQIVIGAAPPMEIVQYILGTSNNLSSIVLNLNDVEEGSSLLLFVANYQSPPAAPTSVSGMTASGPVAGTTAASISGYGSVCRMYYEHDVTAGNKSVTVTLSEEDYSTAVLVEVKGIANAAPSKTGLTGAGSGTAQATSSITDVVDSLVFAMTFCASNNADTTFTTPSGFTRITTHGNSNVSAAIALDYKIVDTLESSLSAAWTCNRSAEWTTIIVSFDSQ